MRRKVKDMPRRQQKAVFSNITQSKIQTKMDHRSPHARAVDRGINARNVYTGRDKAGRDKWMKQPNRSDIQNVDTVIAKEQYRAKVSKESLNEKKQEKKRIDRQLRRKKSQIKQVKKPEEKQKLQEEIKEKEQEQEKTKLDIKDVEVGHRRIKESLHEKREEKHEVMYVMKTTDNNNYVECKALIDRAKNKGVAYDHVDWDQLEGSDLVYEDRVRRLEQQIGKTYTDDEMGNGNFDDERYEREYDYWLSQQKNQNF